MGISVMKFGGTSVGSIERIKQVAKRVIQKINDNERVVVVVSAMGHTTDELMDLACQASEQPSKRELDMLLSTGEQQTIALLAMVLNDQGTPAESFTGWQAGILTEHIHGNARIDTIDTDRLKTCIYDGKVAIVAGFQGLTENGEITTLGRGGSDTTAVALAAALQADICEIYTDVDGVYTTDPRYVDMAQKIDALGYDEMLEMAYLGASVLHPRAVEYAKKFNMPLVVRSSFSHAPGTIIREDKHVEKGQNVRGLAFDRDVVKVSVLGLPNEVTMLSKVFQSLAEAAINVDIIIQNVLNEAETSVSFTISNAELGEALNVLKSDQKVLGFREAVTERGLAKVSIIGSGMASNPGVAATMFSALARSGIMVKMVSTSEIKVSTVIPIEHLENALHVLHQTYKLDAKTVQAY
ncbi:aspartate kinase [Camelliibacillus cellulosilyticus]|uniref:Aspartokinase n=1 Tax=Camelliibacillus cellulosilyticus TaxID=2174486 RepID=A0ABV9GLL6_9BACL